MVVLENKNYSNLALRDHKDLIQQIIQGLKYMKNIGDPDPRQLEQKRLFLERHPSHQSTSLISAGKFVVI